MIDPKNLTTPRRRLVLLISKSIAGEDLGLLLVIDDAEKIFSAVTLQKSGVMPRGTFPIEPYFSPKHKKTVLLLKSTPGHTFLEVHIGNFLKDSEGCACVGRDFQDLNKDGVPDVTKSAATMTVLLALITKPTTITVISI